jgi:hypothetical protein
MSLAGVNCCSVPLIQLKQLTQNRRTTNNMATDKHTKVRDLKPTKDAKGGGARGNTGRGNNAGLAGARGNTGGLNTAGKNTKGHQGHGHGGHN